MTLYPKLILDALATVRYPGTGKNLVEAEMVADNLRIDGMTVSFSLIFEKPTDPFMKSMLKAAETAIHTYVSPDVQVTITAESKQAARPEVGKLLPQVKNIAIRLACSMLIFSVLPCLRCFRWRMHAPMLNV